MVSEFIYFLKSKTHDSNCQTYLNMLYIEKLVSVIHCFKQMHTIHISTELFIRKNIFLMFSGVNIFFFFNFEKYICIYENIF